MGYKEGTGLGKRGQGRVDIIETSLQKGRRGLGQTVKGFEASSDHWNFEKEDVGVFLQLCYCLISICLILILTSGSDSGRC